jgi:hypothetical protein
MTYHSSLLFLMLLLIFLVSNIVGSPEVPREVDDWQDLRTIVASCSRTKRPSDATPDATPDPTHGATTDAILDTSAIFVEDYVDEYGNHGKEYQLRKHSSTFEVPKKDRKFYKKLKLSAESSTLFKDPDQAYQVLHVVFNKKRKNTLVHSAIIFNNNPTAEFTYSLHHAKDGWIGARQKILPGIQHKFLFEGLSDEIELYVHK